MHGEALPLPDASRSDPDADLDEPIYLGHPDRPASLHQRRHRRTMSSLSLLSRRSKNATSAKSTIFFLPLLLFFCIKIS
jgi:hypothetical protein